MTLPQKKAQAESSAPAFLGREKWDDDDRGPANAIIAKLTAAIADQNAANHTLAVPKSRSFRLRPLIALALGSATVWVVVVLAILSLI
ncbi:MAG TPA: hypothetical protein VMU22_09580 [Rhizomicrobium sp.]|nr:hypothetical protein [Rhizomicrobium sp.]